MSGQVGGRNGTADAEDSGRVYGALLLEKGRTLC